MLYLGVIIFTAVVLIQFRSVYMQYQTQFKAPSQTETEARSASSGRGGRRSSSACSHSLGERSSL